MQKNALFEFADKINQIMPVMFREFARRQVSELYKGKITIPQFLLLESLYRDGESKMTALANLMRVSTAAMTGTVERLVRDGYVMRVYDPGDRRIVKIKLTRKGNKLVKGVGEHRRRMVIKIFSRISDGDCADYLRIISQIRDILVKGDV
jgi:DNA-binding MarR family transcriptional regulator